MTPALHHNPSPFARGSLPAAAKAARRSHSLDPRRAAPSFIVNDQVQMGTDTALGRRWGMCRLAPALGRTGRCLAGQGFSKNLAGHFGVRSLSIFRLSQGCRLAKRNRSRDHLSNLGPEMLRHFKLHGSNALIGSDGAEGSAPNQPGEIPNHHGERHHVSRV